MLATGSAFSLRYLLCSFALKVR